MCLSKFAIPAFLVLALIGPGKAYSQSNTAKAKAAKRKKTISKFGMGAGYMIWTETLTAKENGVSKKGYANYAGIILYADKSWTKNRLVYGGSFGLGSGKATAEGFSPAVNYPDAGQRPWSIYYLDAFSFYRIRANVMVGAGAFTYYRMADWKSTANPSVSVGDRNKFGYSPEFLLRWTIGRHMTLVQSISPLNFADSTLWRWSAHYTF